MSNFSKPYTRHIPPTPTDHPPSEPHMKKHYKPRWLKRLHLAEKFPRPRVLLPQYVSTPPTPLSNRRVTPAHKQTSLLSTSSPTTTHRFPTISCSPSKNLELKPKRLRNCVIPPKYRPKRKF